MVSLYVILKILLIISKKLRRLEPKLKKLINEGKKGFGINRQSSVRKILKTSINKFSLYCHHRFENYIMILIDEEPSK